MTKNCEKFQPQEIIMIQWLKLCKLLHETINNKSHDMENTRTTFTPKNVVTSAWNYYISKVRIHSVQRNCWSLTSQLSGLKPNENWLHDVFKRLHWSKLTVTTQCIQRVEISLTVWYQLGIYFLTVKEVGNLDNTLDLYFNYTFQSQIINLVASCF